MGGIYAAGIHRLGPDNATLSVHTKRGGAAAKAGHDLELHVTAWEATLDLEAGTAELSADGSSLRVQKGTGGMQKLGDEDKENIHRPSTTRSWRSRTSRSVPPPWRRRATAGTASRAS